MTKNIREDIKEFDRKIYGHVQKASELLDSGYEQEAVQEFLGTKEILKQYMRLISETSEDNRNKFGILLTLIKFQWFAFVSSLVAGDYFLRIDGEGSERRGRELLLEAERYLSILEEWLHVGDEKGTRVLSGFYKLLFKIKIPPSERDPLLNVYKKSLEDVKRGVFKGLFGYYKVKIYCAIAASYFQLGEIEKGQNYLKKASKVCKDLAKNMDYKELLHHSQKFLRLSKEVLAVESYKQIPIGYIYNDTVSEGGTRIISGYQLLALEYLSSENELRIDKASARSVGCPERSLYGILKRLKGLGFVERVETGNVIGGKSRIKFVLTESGVQFCGRLHEVGMWPPSQTVKTKGKWTFRLDAITREKK